MDSRSAIGSITCGVQHQRRLTHVSAESHARHVVVATNLAKASADKVHSLAICVQSCNKVSDPCGTSMVESAIPECEATTGDTTAHLVSSG